MLVIKEFKSNDAEEDYRRELDTYILLNEYGCGDLILKLIEFNDEKNILIIERGICDLQTFVKLRQEPGNPDGSLTPAELLLIMEYVATAMMRLWKDLQLCLCDTKEQNILIVYSSQGLGGYMPILTDLGAAYCKQVDVNATYPVAYTAHYFDPQVLEVIDDPALQSIGNQS
jgi:hypothetical protein